MYEFEAVSDFLKAIASETRQNILFLLADGKKRTVGEIAKSMNLVESTTSEHLSILKRGGLLKSKREGKMVFYSPDRDQIFGKLDKLKEMMVCCCPEENCCE